MLWNGKSFSLQAKFWIWIGAGCAFFAVAFALSNLLENGMCKERCEQSRSHVASEHRGVRDQLEVPTSGPVYIVQNHYGGSPLRANEPSNQNAVGIPLESPLRLSLSDALLALFTYCLVIVGYFQILRGERNTRELERAILFCGPISVRLSDDPNAPLIPNIVPIPDGSLLHICVQNYGRTPGILKEVFVQFSDIEPCGEVAVYGDGESVKFDMGVQPGNPPSAVTVQPFKSPHKGAHYCFGYIRYLDIFKVEHRNGFCNKIYPGTVQIELAGSSAYSDWD